jgi:hypothetical protein
MRITERPPMAFEGPAGTVLIATQRWDLEPWEGEADPPELKGPWAIKGKFSVNGRRSCAELAILHHLEQAGWQGVWVSAFGRPELRREWFPAPAFRTLADAGAPAWAVSAFDRLLAASDGKLGGFFDVFAWREPGEIRFAEAKVGTDRIRDTQRRFVKRALRFHDPNEFTIVEIAG